MSRKINKGRTLWQERFSGRTGLALVLASISCSPSSEVRGQFLWEYWLGIGGDSIADLTNHPDFPDMPSGRRFLSRLETPRQFQDGYGSRLRGFLHPPISGEYGFVLSSTGAAELWLARDDRPEAKVRLAATSGDGSAPRRSKSELVELEAGKRYYVELLHKEGAGADRLAVRWWIPGMDEAQIITGRWLTPWPMEQVEAIRFGEEGPFPKEPFALHLATPTPGATMRYTTDGSWPSATHGEVYQGPIDIESTGVVRAIAFKGDAVSTEVETRTYVFVEGVANQRNVAPKQAHWNTQMDPQVVDSPIYRDRVVDALLAIPTISLSTSHEDMFGRDGIYRKPTEEGRAWERPASLELILPDGRREFQVHCGVRITGGRSRAPRATPKHSFRIVFRRKYGPGELRYRLFPDSALDHYDGFLLRAGFNHSWATRTAENNYAQYLRNAFARDAQNATGSFNGAGRFVHLYLNGLYWGLYFMEDRQDAAFAAAMFGGEEDDYDVVQDRTPEHGDLKAFKAMFEIANRGLESDENFKELLEYLDLTHFIDYLIVNNFLANYDWPHRNWRAARRREVNARFRFFTWDAEWTLPHYRPVWTNAGNYQEGLTTGDLDLTPGRLFQKLRQNAEFRQRFADRIHRHFLAEDGPFHAGRDRPGARYREWAEQINEAIIAESARWGGTRRTPPFTRDEEWVRERDRISKEWLPRRVGQFLDQCRSENLCPRLEAPTLSRPSGLIESGFEVHLAAPAGTIYFTTDGSDPRRPFEGTIATGARAYQGAPLRLEVATRLKARAFVDGEWSALNEAEFYVRQDGSGLRVTEIMYHPLEDPLVSDGDRLEFLELENRSDARLDLGGLAFVDGIGFTFPMGTILEPGGIVVLASDGEAFLRVHGFQPFEVYRGRLDNGGERIRLAGAGGNVLIDLTYDDRNGWPVLADGGGRSLVSRGPTAGSGEPRDWTASRRDGGSPGVHP